jgi:hypothetical protein
MSDRSTSPDLTQMIEALLSTARTGRAVAQVLEEQSHERADRMVIADLRARRAERVRDADLDAADARRLGAAAGDGVSPWMRSG